MSRILVVEDDELLRETLADALEDAGYHVLPAADGQQALDVLEASPVELIVLDLLLPSMDVHEFRRRQLLMDSVHPPRILVLSALPDVGATAERLGASAWLAKPFRLAVLLDTVNRLLEPAA